jgi:hypothetical protein
MSSKSQTHKRCGTLRKKSFSTRGYAEIHIQRPFFDNKNRIWKILGLKSKRWKHALGHPLHVKFYFKKNTKISIFGGISKFYFWANFGKFGQFWAVLGRFCRIDSGW